MYLIIFGECMLYVFCECIEVICDVFVMVYFDFVLVENVM